MTKNAIHWGRKEIVKQNQLSYYDETVYKVPYTGKFNHQRMWKALVDRFFPPQHNVFGGYSSLSSITNLGGTSGGGTMEVRVLYHIGE